MKLFDGKKKVKKIDDEVYDTLTSIDLTKTFHLSGMFEGGKKNYSEKIKWFGGKCRGFKGSDGKHLNLSKTDYFIIGNNYYWEGDGGNAKEIDKHNQKNGKYIPKIKQSHCDELISQYKPLSP